MDEAFLSFLLGMLIVMFAILASYWSQEITAVMVELLMVGAAIALLGHAAMSNQCDDCHSPTYQVVELRMQGELSGGIPLQEVRVP